MLGEVTPLYWYKLWAIVGGLYNNSQWVSTRVEIEWRVLPSTCHCQEEMEWPQFCRVQQSKDQGKRALYQSICLSSLDPYVILNGMKLPLGLFTYLRGKASLRHLQSYLVHLLVDVSDSLKAPRARNLAGCRSHGLCQVSGVQLQVPDWGSRERWWVVPSSRLFAPLAVLLQLQRLRDLQGMTHQWQRRAVHITMVGTCHCAVWPLC